MSALSYHPRRRRGKTARAFWDFTAEWQRETGELHVAAGYWHLVELASRFPFRSVRMILSRCIPLARARQIPEGGFKAGVPEENACLVALAYARHGLWKSLLSQLRYDPIPSIRSLETPLGLKARREALGEPRASDARLAQHLVDRVLRAQRRDGSWEELILATTAAIHDLLDCGVSAEAAAVRRACDWLLALQRPVDAALFPAAARLELTDMFYTARVREELDFERTRHPAWRWKKRGIKCVELLPIYQTAAAVGALCRCGFGDSDAAKSGFAALMGLRGPGGKYYTNYWCACNAPRWLRTGAPKFDSR